MDLPPLAERMRPRNLSEWEGQESLIHPQSFLSRALEQKRIPSMIFWGPPGCGKTTLARIIADSSEAVFHSISAIHSGVKEIREIIELSKKASLFKKGTDILFIDEIHRFNKSQQDSLLEAVERGWIILLGATTENPSFEVIPALLSRCQVLVLNPLKREDLDTILKRAVKNDPVLKQKTIRLEETDRLISLSGGDARRLLNLLEILVNSSPETEISIQNKWVDSLLSKNPLAYDKSGEGHYDTISAFIKSVRGSDPNASIYWLARMIASGENPLFLARRMIVLASEDIGNANPMALVLANACFQTVHSIGMPEARIILGQTAVYLANSPKSNSTYLAIDEALDFVKKEPEQPVPLYLRNAPTPLMKDLDYGNGYIYPHLYSGHFESQEYFPEALSGKQFYRPADNEEENQAFARIQKRWGGKYSEKEDL
jgi:putative ATPase